jgi:hypothetical protein
MASLAILVHPVYYTYHNLNGVFMYFSISQPPYRRGVPPRLSLLVESYGKMKCLNCSKGIFHEGMINFFIGFALQISIRLIFIGYVPINQIICV